MEQEKKFTEEGIKAIVLKEINGIKYIPNSYVLWELPGYLNIKYGIRPSDENKEIIAQAVAAYFNIEVKIADWIEQNVELY